MAFFYSFTESLKQKWLQFFQANHDWIKLHMQVESVYTPDGGKRPPSYLILGVVNALEPKLAQLMLPFSKLNADADTLIEVLGLHFDPDIALGNSVGYPSEDQAFGNEADDSIDTSGFAEVATAQGFSMAAPDDDSEESMATSMSSGDVHMHQTATIDEFGDVSFDGEMPTSSGKSESGSFGEADLNAPAEENGFSDVLMDVWGEENNSPKSEEEGDMLLGEDFGSGAFDDTEIARLFPNG